MWLTGHAGGAPVVPGRAVREQAGVMAASLPAAVAVDVDATLFGRAAWMGLGRQGRWSAGGSCRLLRAADGWVAVNLSRPDDIASVPAVVGGDAGRDPWDVMAAFSAAHPARDVADRCQLLGVPAGALPGPASSERPAAPSRTTQLGDTGPVPERPLVVDLSSMWAGPLCARLLGQAGARVVKVESPGRPDGARFGHPELWRWLHDGNEFVTVDFRSPELAELLRRADVVIEASRPRALRDLGIVAEDIVAEGRGRTWVSITGYGRNRENGMRVAFGDDAAVAGGLVAYDGTGEPVFIGDALADPLTGLAAASAAWESMAAGGGRLVEVAMVDVVRWCAAPAAVPSHEVGEIGPGRWAVRVGHQVHEVRAPRAPGVAA
jgi:hypothetical protein